MRAACYVRVSTLEQATEGYSVGVQKEKLLHYANAQSYDVIDTYADEGYSGKSLLRPAVERLITDVKARKVDIVLIYKLDRLSRHVKDVLELVELFEQYKVTLYSLNENLDLSSPFGRAALKMSATFSELERETIVERMEMGKIARAKSGKYTCPGKSPFGYKLNKETDRLEIVPEEAEAVQEMYAKYIEGYTFRKLYAYCKEKFPDIRFFSNSMCCKPVIERPMYTGYFLYKGELIKATNYDPIISYETYLQAKAMVEKNRTKRSKDNSPYLLTGLVYCAQCGNRYVGKLYDRYSKKANGDTTKHYKYRFYGCAARIKRDKTYHPAKCYNEILDACELEEHVECYIKNISFSEFKSGNFVPGIIDGMMTENSALKDKLKRLLDLYVDGNLDKESYLLRKEEIEKKIIENDKLIACETENAAQCNPESISTLKEWLKNYDALPKSSKSKLLSFLIKSIVIDGEKITINLNVQ